MQLFKCVLYFYLAVICLLDAKRILLMSPFGSKTQTTTLNKIGHQLSSKGYETHLISGRHSPNSTVHALDTTNTTLAYERNYYAHNQFPWYLYPLTWIHCFEALIDSCPVFYEESAIQNLVKSNLRYDAIVVDSVLQECTLPLAYKLGAPIVFLKSNVDPKMVWIGTSDCSYSYSEPLTLKMNFIQRIGYYIDRSILMVLHEWWYLYRIEQIAKEYLGPLPHLVDIISSARQDSAVVNDDDSRQRRSVPSILNSFKLNVVVGELSQEFESVLKSVDDDEGFILFSRGKSSENEQCLPPKIYRAFVEAFSRISRTIIWKGNWSENLPRNVHTFPHLPQQNLLGHRKIRLFITDGGIFDVEEAALRGIPVLVLEKLVEEKFTVNQQPGKGFVFSMLDGEMSAELLYDAISAMLKDQNYRQTARCWSSLSHDTSRSPIDRAIFSIETLAQYGNLRHNNGRDSSLVQYFISDLIVFSFLFLLFVWAAVCIGYAVVISILQRFIFPFLYHNDQGDKRNNNGSKL